MSRVEQITGYRHEALAIAELREAILPVLRADVELHEAYVDHDQTTLPVAITVFRGRDDHVVSLQDAEEWKTVTSVGADIVEMPGGHMYLTQDPTPCMDAMATVLGDA